MTTKRGQVIDHIKKSGEVGASASEIVTATGTSYKWVSQVLHEEYLEGRLVRVMVRKNERDGRYQEYVYCERVRSSCAYELCKDNKEEGRKREQKQESRQYER